MIVIEKNLEQLASQYKICDNGLIDDYSLKIQLGSYFFEPTASAETIIYGACPDPSLIFSNRKSIGQNLSLAPGKQVITCSKHTYKLPTDYFGLVQTKGTLARLFVSATCNDGQIEPGFDGYITLEMVNHSPWTLEIPVGSDIAQMYLIKCTSPALKAYSGRYAKGAKEGPTIAIYNR